MQRDIVILNKCEDSEFLLYTFNFCFVRPLNFLNWGNEKVFFLYKKIEKEVLVSSKVIHANLFLPANLSIDLQHLCEFNFDE